MRHQLNMHWSIDIFFAIVNYRPTTPSCPGLKSPSALMRQTCGITSPSPPHRHRPLTPGCPNSLWYRFFLRAKMTILTPATPNAKRISREVYLCTYTGRGGGDGKLWASPGELSDRKSGSP